MFSSAHLSLSTKTYIILISPLIFLIFSLQLFDDVVTLTIILKYHVIPGLSLEFEDFKDGQPYYTLLTDKKKNKYVVEFDFEKEIDLKSLKLDGSLEDATSRDYFIVPSGGDEAEVCYNFKLNPAFLPSRYIIIIVLCLFNLTRCQILSSVQITTFDINAGCPTVVHVIDYVLIPEYEFPLLADAGDLGIEILTTYEEAGAPLPGAAFRP